MTRSIQTFRSRKSTLAGAVLLASALLGAHGPHALTPSDRPQPAGHGCEVIPAARIAMVADGSTRLTDANGVVWLVTGDGPRRPVRVRYPATWANEQAVAAAWLAERRAEESSPGPFVHVSADGTHQLCVAP